MIAKQTEAESSVQTQTSLQEEKEDLSVRLEGERKLHLACREELRLKSLEATRRLTQIESLEEKYSQSNAERDNLLGSTKQLELEVQEWKLLSEQFQSDLEASKSLTEKLRLELEQKQQDAMGLLSSRDEAVSAAVKELRDLQAAESQALEERLKEAEQERRRIQEKLAYVTAQMSSSEEEAGRNKVHLEALTKSMCSLQNERERMLSEYQQLEQTHLSSILAKDALIQEAAAESNELREELRNLRSRTDDLNAQNAKLDAQLAQYRQDLKELISLKDSQLKQLLGEKLQHIERLQNESGAQAQQLKEEKEHKEALQQELAHLQDEVQSMRLYVTQLQSTQEALEREDKRLREELAQLEGEVVRGREESSQLQADAALRVQRAEQELSKKLQSMQHDTGILRNETETAEERVAELARDLMQAEQRLLLANEENAAIRAKLQAFEGSMRSLQDSHDLVNEELNSLRKQQEKLASLSEELSFVSAERDRLRQEMKQLSNNSQLEPLSKDLSSLQRIRPGKEEERNIQASADVKVFAD
ncbi:golgin subfamily B member 1 [Bombina bombina]|uniref:golgin subfamily B member 1 n=1 Tax=Bombina bombina TaxID=8345 RepID=UPI00235AA2ED|nr:golgin subfamily B member 1 [Bombina bombina]